MAKHNHVPNVTQYRDINNNVVNFGNLSVGIINGRMCLAASETLLLLGVNLTKHKVPPFFNRTTKLVVMVTGSRGLTVWVLSNQDLDSVARNLSYRCSEVKVVEVFTNRVLSSWFGGRNFSVSGEYVLPPEPKPTPKLSFWAKLKKHIKEYF